ncbi:MAG TPA: ABC transporter permease subunit [Dehalococcoidia bacterium]|nr:ABC transporter permease subunit [Dehalococcoidia bacterium]
MSEQTTPSRLQTGIYDLGYRTYDGARLGRLYAITSLFTYSLRAVFGLGRGWVAKLFAMGLAAIASIPALVQLAIAAIVPADFEYVGFESYFSFVSIVLALFCAVAAPEVVGRDQRHRTLALYFSRALSRSDYVAAKWVALLVGLLIVLLIPQALLLTGNAVATEEVVDYLKDNLGSIPPIIGSSLVVATMMGSLSLAIACQTPRRYWASGAVIIYFVIATALGAILQETISGSDGDYAFLISPIHVLEGTVYWIFNATPDLDSDIYGVAFDGVYFFAAAVGYSLLGLAVVYRRFAKMAI